MENARRSIPERVIQKAANRANCDVLDLPPLYDSVDPDALAALVDRMSDGEITFSYAGYRVTVVSDGTVSLDGGSARGDVDLGECGA